MSEIPPELGQSICEQLAEEARSEEGQRLRRVLFEAGYPYVAAWVREMGPIEIGYRSAFSDPSFLQVIQDADLIWSSNKTYTSLDEASGEMDAAIAKWCAERSIGWINDEFIWRYMADGTHLPLDLHLISASVYPSWHLLYLSTEKGKVK